MWAVQPFLAAALSRECRVQSRPFDEDEVFAAVLVRNPWSLRSSELHLVALHVKFLIPGFRQTQSA